MSGVIDYYKPKLSGAARFFQRLSPSSFALFAGVLSLGLWAMTFSVCFGFIKTSTNSVDALKARWRCQLYQGALFYLEESFDPPLAGAPHGSRWAWGRMPRPRWYDDIQFEARVVQFGVESLSAGGTL